jgi:hypothetical protein
LAWANFENHGRIVPSRKNLISIVASLEQAGVQFIPEDVSAGLGPGVRLRQLQLEYSKDLRADGWDLIFRVRFKGHDCLVTITREIIDNCSRQSGDAGGPCESRRAAPSGIFERRRKAPEPDGGSAAQKRYNISEVVAIETAITDALGAAFGPGTDRFDRWRALDPRRAMKLPPACGAPAGVG